MTEPVSCETLDLYAKLIHKWNRRTFLVQESTMHAVIERHFNDSLQLADHIPAGSKILDIGSGAGFPGMLLAMTGDYDVSLCEANKKKCIFLLEVSRETGTAVEIINERVEELEQHSYDYVTARGFTSLAGLISYMKKLGVKSGVFLKGKKHMNEIQEAKKVHSFEYEVYDSKTSVDGKVVVVRVG